MEASPNGALISGDVRDRVWSGKTGWPAEMGTGHAVVSLLFTPIVFQGRGGTVFSNVQL